MKNALIWLVGFCLIQVACQASPVPIEIKKTVAFIYALNSTNVVPDGTAFFVGVPDTKSTNRTYVYLVTARHVLRPATNFWLPEVFVRLNCHDGTSEQIPLKIVTDGPFKNAFTHSDDTVDIVVVPFAPKAESFDFKILPVDFITSSNDFKNLEIQEGSDVFFTGMFTHHLGEKQNTPITRFGRVALMTDEKIDWVFGKTDLYLIEANSFPGNSGSPVFFQIGVERSNGSLVLPSGPNLRLAGVMSGCYQDVQPIKTLSVSTNQFVTPNLGVAGVVPAYELKDILYSPELKAQRGE